MNFSRLSVGKVTRLIGIPPADQVEPNQFYLIETGGTIRLYYASSDKELFLLTYNDELAQDAVGSIMFAGNTVDLQYNDLDNLITAEVIDGSITFTYLQDVSNNILLGNDSIGTEVKEIAVGNGLDLDMGELLVDESELILANLGGDLPQSRITNLVTDLANKQPLDSDLTAIAGLAASNDDIIQRKAGAWTNRTIAQIKSDLSLSGSNTGDQTITLTSDVTGSGTGSFATTIANSAVSLAKMANLAANSIIGNNTGSPATPVALTVAQVKTLLSLNNVENTALSTWAGSANITTLGTISTGSWGGTTIPINKGGTGSTSFTTNGVAFYNGTVITSSADITYASLALSIGASTGGGEVRSHQNTSGFYMALKTDTVNNLSGIYRNNPGFTSGFPIAYSTATGDILINAFFGSGNKISMQLQGTELGKWDSSGLTVADGKNIIFNTTTGTKIGTSTTQKLGFWNSAPIVKPTVTGSKASGAALTSLLTQLATMGLIVDSTSA